MSCLFLNSIWEYQWLCHYKIVVIFGSLISKSNTCFNKCLKGNKCQTILHSCSGALWNLVQSSENTYCREIMGRESTNLIIVNGFSRFSDVRLIEFGFFVAFFCMPQRESSLKISTLPIQPFRKCQGISKQTDILFLQRKNTFFRVLLKG